MVAVGSRWVIALALAFIGALAVAPAARAGTQVLSDNFTGSNSSLAWQVYGSACLTAGSGGSSIPACAAGSTGGYTGNVPDSSGQGALLLTRAVQSDVGGIISLNSFPSSAGFTVTFNAVSYGGSGADGISFFLLDASQGVPASLGYIGGSLGYVNIAGGFMGVGIDEYGNFSNPGCGGGGCSGGPGLTQNAVAVRGLTSAASPYITHAVPGFSLWSNVSTRQQATSHTYTISMTAAGSLSVAIDGTTYVSGLNASAQVGALPAYLRVGIASSTGGATNFHQITSFSVTSLSTSNITVSKVHTVMSDPVNGATNPKLIPGATVRYCVIVANLTGNPTATGIAVADPLTGLHLTYVANSIRVNGTASNGVCTWNGSTGGSYASGTVSASLANLAGGATSTMYFDATVQ
ncbi:lectin-like domain-containing protein [Novosphingobium lentum]|uniref:lectin-like domain-containing protein n=1 Tax=Novosphingobium lentum TaxID=145287 RepID=UPI000B21F44A|nr:hypothetical protein [Novosphingobium lentum]